MANVAHSTLTGSNLHENKGVSSATDNTVATAVSGATVWAKLTASNLQTTGNPFGAQLFHVRDSAALSLSSGSWQTRPITTSVTNEITSASLSTNQITLPSGTYFIDALLTGRIVQTLNNSSSSPGCQARLRNITAGSDILYSNVASNYLYDSGTGGTIGSGATFPLILKGRFTLAGSTVLELQTYHTSGTLDSQEIVSGIPIINTQAYVWKVA